MGRSQKQAWVDVLDQGLELVEHLGEVSILICSVRYITSHDAFFSLVSRRNRGSKREYRLISTYTSAHFRQAIRTAGKAIRLTNTKRSVCLGCGTTQLVCPYSYHSLYYTAPWRSPALDRAEQAFTYP